MFNHNSCMLRQSHGDVGQSPSCHELQIWYCTTYFVSEVKIFTLRNQEPLD
jgi:hypothetical protein